ncbi:LAFE_0B11100g1_1 [Lachancea fermentati]|uniref:LAFE_0B11100g1_1 n=1 Tax=Lachancea fermentati TaxID=4955 RepID=A0A1G4M8N0_LACFM|nr:LAFE_0B11100g1_1 [Lachancea fermentati]
MQLIFGLLTAFLAATTAVARKNSGKTPASNDTSLNRPLIHFTPEKGWMNDPNGLFYDNVTDLWHMYYQFNPNDTVWGQPLYWGHATSKNLTTWTHENIAIGPDSDDAGVFSGSIVIDYNNTSNFFNSSINPGQRVVAFYTYNTAESQTQYVAYSLDGGYTFTKYSGNPVLNLNSTQFRDPKVFWHDETEKWIMVLALSQEYKVQIYSSENLKEWELQSNFSHHGILGYQYECPGLSKIPIVKSSDSSLNSSNSTSPDYKWVMFLSINPGAPQGGSFTQYFIGDFDGKNFTADDHQTRFLDFGKDYYAFQAFDNTPNNDVLGVAWASNWEYGGFVPTSPWRSSMSLIRNFTLQEYHPNGEATELNLFSQPVIDHDVLNANHTIHKGNLTIGSGKNVTFDFHNSATGLVELNVTFKVNTSSIRPHDFVDLSFYLRGASDPHEYLRLGYENTAPAFFLDRGNSKVNFVSSNPFYTDKTSVNFLPYSTELNTYKIYAIADRNILEVYLNDGLAVSTNTFFFTEGNHIGSIDVIAGIDGVYELVDFEVKQLSVKQ